MMQRWMLVSGLGLLACSCVVPWSSRAHAQPGDAPQFERLMRMYRDGNYAEAYDGLRQLVLARDTAATNLPEAFGTAVACLHQLNRIEEIDDFREQAVTVHPTDWRLLASVARSYLEVPHYGTLIGGEFRRGPHRGGGRVVHATARDRVRALQLYHQAMRAAESADEKNEPPAVVLVLRPFAHAIIYGADSNQAWRLQTLTNLDELPDYEEGWGQSWGQTAGAPVDEEGNPIFYDVPTSWEAAQNDGERWRWLLAQLVERDPTQRSYVSLARAEFLLSQFGVHTMAEYRILLARGADDDQSADRPATWALDTLDDDETIARLATGIKRFKLPDEHNFIKLFERVLADAPTDTVDAHGIRALTALGDLFENRRQYPRAAEFWRRAVELTSGQQRESYQRRLEQIVGNWGQFENVMSQPAGEGASVEFRYRNAPRVEFVAHEINVRKLLDDVKAYLKSNPQQLDWQKLNISEIGYRLVQEDGEQYVGAEAARWSLNLESRAGHFDRRITVTTPLQKSGAYLLTANVADGNTSKIVLWLADTAIVRKPLTDKSLYYVADAVTGQPIARANVEFFGYRQRHIDGRRFQVDTAQSAELTSADGQALLPIAADDGSRRAPHEFQWIATATTTDGRFAFLGFHNVWRAPYHDADYKETKAFMITDRPVYRPGQTVNFKFWIRQAQYDLEDKSQFAHQAFAVEIFNPMNERVFNETLTSDSFGGLAGKFELPSDATLGQYRLHVVNRGGGTFRVDEYKKPEYEVTVEAPGEPVMLGEPITATIRAQYYFGSPVTSATVRYKVLRTEHRTHWFPPGPWDWLYGPGYWWFASNYDWYPGWREWGCGRPAPWWFIWQPAPPEIVVEREVPIGPDGTVKVEIDTSLAKAAHPNQDHRYQIQAEVIDASRRTIVGSGEVLVARKPFEVFAWVNRGYFRVDDTIQASFAARRIDGQPVAGSGKLRLLKISYGEAPERKPSETEVRTWDLPTNAQGLAELQIKASEAGQYRLAYRVTDAAGHEIEGGYLFTIIGAGFNGSDFQFNDLEIVPRQRHYAPGDKVELQVNTNRVGSTVLLFARPAGGVYLPPQLLRLDGKSTTVELEVTQRDVPNFFVEAVTIAHGKVHTETREIFVPPASRVLNVDVMPSANAFQPGQQAKVKLKLTDATGEPFAGSTVISIYDKAVEYIAGGSNVPNIKEFFWKWRRHHRPYIETNLARWFNNLVPPGQQGMGNLGIFGDTVADEAVDLFADKSSVSDGAPARARVMLGAEVAPTGASRQNSFDSGEAAAPSTPLVEPTVRSEFADTALWVAALETGRDGLAEVDLKMPENLTTWKIRVWGLGHGTRVGEAAAEVVTRKNLIVRMQAPRFFIERDEVVLSANVHNYLPDAKMVQVRLEQDGDTLELPSVIEETVEIPAGGERRVDWRVKVRREGNAVIRMLALTDTESDAMQVTLPVHVHGMLKMDSFSGAIRDGQSRGRFEAVVPRERRAEQTRLEVRYSPTLAGAMVDALPYLADYPYGCTEQTLNRFLPAVITQKTLLRMGLNLKEIQEKRTNLNAQELGDAAERAQQWQRFPRNPVFDEAELSKMVRAGVNRLQEMQLADGGWGWFTGWGEHSTPHTTAVVVRGLAIARDNDVALVPGMLERGIEWLTSYQQEQFRRLDNADDAGTAKDKTKPHKPHTDNLDALVYTVLVDAGVTSDSMRDFLYRDRTKLAVYGLALYGTALHKLDETDKLAMVLRNIRQYLVEDDTNQTAYLNLPAGQWWHWYGSEFEAHAYYLKLLAATEPESRVASRLVKYLINNRKHATYWNSTRDTALVIEALADFLKASGEDRPDLTVEVWLNGQKRKEVKIDADNLFTFDNAFVLAGDALEAGRHTIELRTSGSGPLYWNGYLTNFTLEDDIRRAGLELQVNRRYYKLTPAERSIDVPGGRGQPIGQRVEKYERTEIPNLGSVTSGDLIEIELTIESKNDYEYLVFEDMKAAGTEPVDLQSGYTGNELGAYVEYRDNRVVLFARHLPRGRHSVSYRMRAEVPGRFSALPAVGSAMYAPELRGNSDELKLRIEDRASSEGDDNR